ncbi:Hypothetical protein HVIM_04498 (plasmid) [Roseomonas mucosa]|uniref:DUF262 domain-containing protein n=1 Tax=Roseomonas mucosa TaxID=207340 RepID=UPI0024C6DE1D|nr:DUF262 domain-containing protein [Roseomonas mucosa]QDD92666.1 Hypothetical protein HVIM_04498 [Roseomonas mucosa]
MAIEAPGVVASPEQAEEQIRAHARDVDYAVREYPIEVLVSKYLDGADRGENEIFVPDYQRNFVWSDEQQSRFVESVLIGLPIPYLFVADVRSDDEALSGRLEIVDGTQRIRTLAAFVTDELRLVGLHKLVLLNRNRFGDLLPSRRRRFLRTTVRLIELTEHADEDTRRDMFDRINSGGTRLNPMEQRRGTNTGPLLDLIRELSEDPLLHSLAPLSQPSIKRRDYEELVARFFAYSERYEQFVKQVEDFVDTYIQDRQKTYSAATDGPAMRTEWTRMLNFVERGFEHGFRSPRGGRTPRVRFEAISAGVALALQRRPNLTPDLGVISSWAYGDEFNRLVTSDGANSRPRVTARIEFVRDRLLELP